ncbi:hypothetical protein B0H14DRAFT_2629261 [Mycena olivaceomarginata]|nr:hypothetical protein B0H14DRAFT_2629261 [Mycena olivaceomarginata]
MASVNQCTNFWLRICFRGHPRVSSFWDLACGAARRSEKGRGPETEEWGRDDPTGDVWGGMGRGLMGQGMMGRGFRGLAAGRLFPGGADGAGDVGRRFPGGDDGAGMGMGCKHERGGDFRAGMMGQGSGGGSFGAGFIGWGKCGKLGRKGPKAKF